MKYLFTERAHLACPAMCFAIAVTHGKTFEKERFEYSIKKMTIAHPFLRSRLGYEKKTNSYFYDVKDQSQIELIFAGELSDESGTDADIIKEFERLTSRDWNLFIEGFLKIAVWKVGNKTIFLFVFHHLLADGRGALGLVQEFVDFYAEGIEPKAASEHLITKNDLPANSKLSLISRVLVNHANRQWEKENHQLSYEEYHSFADKFLKVDFVAHSLELVSADKLTNLHAQCKEHNISINDYLLAKMFTEEKTDSIIMACDLRNQLACYNHGALGNYATAFSVKLKQQKSAVAMKMADPAELFFIAQKVHNQIQKKRASPKELYLILQCYASLEPGLLDAAFISSRGAFDSKAARFIGTSFFNYDKAKGYSITNLGKIESKNIDSAFFIPPASPAIKKTQGVLTVNGVMRICTSQRK
ncbi:MAG: hypothetical protein J6N81_08455 [Treponema sp.]|nr:hypothetical protein [Treponema sp.]MBO6219588.1 hypothetical protein [Treponema sp.]